ncbi:abcG18, partial [Symbiodinium pilosum]
MISSMRGSTNNEGDVRSSGIYSLQTMLWYRTGSRYRDLHFLGARFGDKIALGIVFVSLYWRIGEKEDLASVQSTCGIFFFLVAMCGFTATSFLPALVLERSLFYRERADGLYNSVTYYAVKLIEEAVMSVVVIFLFSLALYTALGLYGSFGVFFATLYTTNFIGIVVAYAIAAIAPNMEIANATLPAYLASTACVCGFFILCENMAYPWQCYSAISFMKYAWALLMLNHFGEHPGGESNFYYKDGEIINVIDFYGMDEGITSSIPLCFAALIGVWFVFVAAGILGLAFITHARR